MKQLSDEFLRDVATAAVEGGIGYWSRVDRYKWREADGTEMPFPEIVLVETSEYDEDVAILHLTKEHIVKGISRIVGGGVEINSEMAATLSMAVRDDDAGMVDSELADCIVQVGLFDEIVYG